MAMNGNFAQGMSQPLRAGIQALGMAPLARQQAQLQAGLQAAQAGAANVTAATGQYRLDQLQNPETRAALDQLAPGLGVLFGTGENPATLATAGQGALQLNTRRGILDNLGDPGTNPDAINRALSVSEGKPYEPYSNIGETGTTINKGNGAIGEGNPALVALFGEGARADIAGKQAQADKYRADARNAGRTYDTGRGVMIDQGSGQATPVRGPDGQPIGASAGAFNKAYDEGKAKNMVETEDSLRKAGIAAGGTLAKLDEMQSLVGDFEGGALTNVAMQAAAIGNSLGIQIDPKLGDKQAAAALFNEFALKLKNAGGVNAMPGALSDRDLAFLQATAPQLTQTAAGRQQIIERYRAVAQREQQVARMADQYKTKNNGRLDDGFFSRLTEWSNRPANILFGTE